MPLTPKQSQLLADFRAVRETYTAAKTTRNDYGHAFVDHYRAMAACFDAGLNPLKYLQS